MSDSNNNESIISFVKKAKAINTPIVKNEPLKGWIEITKDKNTQKSIFIHSINTNTSNISNTCNAELVFYNLCKKYEDFIDNYIYNWGEEEYIKMFQFPNYDYNYFDQLDEDFDESYSDSESESYSYDMDYMD